jgi:lipopolysaccharide/colanic/teichoic acid biosynthesis glycosyltransferase
LAVLTLPLQIILATLVRDRLGSPILFRQTRPGLHAEPFEMVKFRSMTNEVDGQGNLLPDHDRLTRFGRFLRSTSLDELPELLNVIKGDMSLVGPRPLLMKYLPRYSAAQAQRHSVRPGITGWSQVNGRNDQSWTQKFELDLWYVQNVSLRLDMRTLIKTVGTVLRRSGVSAAGHATAHEFNGRDDKESPLSH